MEMGKDIIAIDDHGIPCAFQLKTARNGKISLGDWNGIIAQMRNLVYLKINHPSIGDYDGSHRSFLVTNGFIEEEASRAIADFNQTLLQDKRRPVETKVKGEILDWAKAVYPSVIPSELKDIKSLLEFYLEDGTSYFPKGRFSSLLESFFDIHNVKKGIPNTEVVRKISSAALVTSIALTQYSSKENWIAEVEGWTVYLSILFALAEKLDIPEDLYELQFDLVGRAVHISLLNLLEELKKRPTLLEGNLLPDVLYYRVRITFLIGLLSFLWFWKKDEVDESDRLFIEEFIYKHKEEMLLWGEGAVPQFLTFYWFYRNTDATPRPDFLLPLLIKIITTENDPRTKAENCDRLAPPYYQAQETILFRNKIKPLESEDTFRGRSFFLESLVQLFVRRNWKIPMVLLWPDITHIDSEEFIPEEKWQFYLWKSPKGIHRKVISQRTGVWADLKLRASQNDLSALPQRLLAYPHLLLLFLCIYPHRANTSLLKFLDDKLFN
jgi:hypothetical protein